MAKNKTQPTKMTVSTFLNAIEDVDRRRDCKTIAKLGKHKKGKSCLYIKRLSDVNMAELERLLKAGRQDMQKRYPG